VGIDDDDEGETDEGEQLIPGRYQEEVLAEGVIHPTTRGWMVDAWLTGKPPTVRFIISELGDDGLMYVRASSDDKNDDGPSASGKNYIEALDALEKKLSEKLLS